MNPTISIIVPIYNAEQYLNRCLDSILAQDYRELEVILVDDGSTDNSPAICDKYAKEHDNIRVLHIPNGGASLARKKGIEVSKGEYLTFADSDDYIAQSYVSKMYALIKKYGTKISACGVKRVNVNENETVKVNVNVEDQLLSFESLMPRFFKYEFWGFWGGLYHRSVFEGLTFPKATLAEDYYVKTQMFCRERQMAVTNVPLYFYEYYHPSSLSHTKISERAFDEFDNVKAVYEYTKTNCPEYSDYALSNVVETAMKLCVKGDRKTLRKYYVPIYQFLKEEQRMIASLKILNKNVRYVAKGLAWVPDITIWAVKHFF